MPQKSTAINLGRLFLNLQSQANNGGDRSLLSLDTHKAFDSIEWDYLWAIMHRVLSPGFNYYIKPLRWLLGRRPEFPPAPLLFDIAIEPTAALIRSNANISGFQYCSLHKKCLLYADDTMLLLGDITLPLFSSGQYTHLRFF